MPERTALIYCYDGSFDGLLCCVFESYDRNELPSEVLTSDSPCPRCFPYAGFKRYPTAPGACLTPFLKKWDGTRWIFSDTRF
jgi:hypothetical protein